MDFLTWLRAEWDRVLGWGLVAAGIVLLIFGFRGVADSSYLADELAYLFSGGLWGLACIGVGTTLVRRADSHDEWRKLDEIERLLRSTDRHDSEDRHDAHATVNGSDAEHNVDASNGVGVVSFARQGRRP